MYFIINMYKFQLFKKLLEIIFKIVYHNDGDFLGKKDEDIVSGNSEYVPLCRKHWLLRMEKKKK